MTMAPMLAYLLDWAGLLIRWLHIIAGIAWIGASFYFVWLDNHLLPPASDADPRVAGEVWAVHGGGFYRAQKFRVAPAALPPTLHWFYWEAYTTWLSGFALLCLLYFLRAEAYLIDPAVANLSKPEAIAIALAVIGASWLAYDTLCRSAPGDKPRFLAATLAVMVCLLAWGLCQLFGGRGAFMIYGAALGTLMVANVLFVIIPGQRELVRAKVEGREPDPATGVRGKQRSVHNTYFTLPVLFVMISNHYAMTYSGPHNWLVLIALSFAGACIRAWFVARHKPAQRTAVASALPAVLAAMSLAAVVLALAPRVPAAAGAGSLAADAGLRAQWIVERRCVPCHATAPPQPGFRAAPNGLILESMDQLRAHLPDVQQQLALHAMPLGNLTGMTEDERSQLLAWLARAAP